MTAADRFAELVRGPEDVLSRALDEAALLIAAQARPELDVDEYLARLDDLATGCPGGAVEDVVGHLFGVEGFRGNSGDYYDARNSYLDAVIDRRLGIPITLSVVLIEVARRLGLVLSGVGMPARFLVRKDNGAPRFIDCFAGGAVLDELACAQAFAAWAPDTPFDPAYLAPVGPRAILARMLQNLKAIHTAGRDTGALEWVLRLRVSIPGVPLRERAELAHLLAGRGDFYGAATVLEEAAALGTGEAADRLQRRARRLRARLN